MRTNDAPRARTPGLLLFAGNFLRHPHMLGSIIPSSRQLVDAVLAHVDWTRARVIVEYGPGVGTFTAEILRRMRSDARLLAIETNPDFVSFMGSSLRDSRLHVELGSAEQLPSLLVRHGLVRANYIVSGVPLGSMPRSLQAGICEASRAALEPDGGFLVYQFTSRVLPVLNQTFTNVRRGVVVRNFPPARLFVCSNRAPDGTVTLR